MTESQVSWISCLDDSIQSDAESGARVSFSLQGGSYIELWNDGIQSVWNGGWSSGASLIKVESSTSSVHCCITQQLFDEWIGQQCFHIAYFKIMECCVLLCKFIIQLCIFQELPTMERKTVALLLSPLDPIVNVSCKN